MSNKLLNERAASLTKWISELDHDDEFEERIHKTLLVNFQHVRRGALEEVRRILREFITKNYIDQVLAVVKEIERRVRYL